MLLITDHVNDPLVELLQYNAPHYEQSLTCRTWESVSTIEDHTEIIVQLPRLSSHLERLHGFDRKGVIIKFIASHSRFEELNFKLHHAQSVLIGPGPALEAYFSGPVEV